MGNILYRADILQYIKLQKIIFMENGVEWSETRKSEGGAVLKTKARNRRISLRRKKKFQKSKYQVLIGKVKVIDPESRQVLRGRRLRCLQLHERSG